MGKVPVVEYVEHLIQTCAGYRTPQAVLYSMDLTFRMVCGKLGLCIQGSIKSGMTIS